MRRVVTLIRHGLTDWNVEGRFQGHSDRPLCDAGREQARQLRAVTATFTNVDHFVSSPLQRALETARLAFPGQEPSVDPRLAELDFGIFEGGTAEENAAKPEWSVWAEDPYARVAPQGESYADLRERAGAWFDALPEDAAHVVAVTHSGTIQMLLAHVLGIDRPRWKKRIFVRHSSVSRILVTNEERIIERINDTRHLEPAANEAW